MNFSSDFIEMPFNNNYDADEEEKTMDELRIILQQEDTTYFNNFDYISFQSGKPQQQQCCDEQKKQPSRPSSRKYVSNGLRRKISEWLFEVADHFDFDREVVSVALNYIDRVAAIQTQATGQSIGRHEYQLIAVTSLYLAVKLHGETGIEKESRYKLGINIFVEISRRTITAKALKRKELEILQLLQWNVNPPTTARIVTTLLRLLPEWTTTHGHNDNSIPHNPRHMNCTTAAAVYEMASYLTELTLCVSEISFHYKPSEIAYASILCAMDAIEKKVLIPYEIRLKFMNKVMECTNLTPRNVAHIRKFFVNLQTQQPNMFSAFDSFSYYVSTTGSDGEGEEISSREGRRVEHDRNTSPAGVVTQYFD